MNLKENQEFAQKIKKNDAMSKKMNQTSTKFKQFEQLALYSEPDESSKNMIITINSKDQQKWQPKQIERTNMEIVIGMKQPTGAKSIEKILLNLINMMPKPSSSYSVIYVNTLANGNAFGDFRKILQFLPAQYFIHLEKIYVLHGNFKNKASYWISFDYFTNYLKNKTTHFTTFNDLADKIGINKESFLKILPLSIVKQLEKKETTVKQILQLKKVKENIVFNSNVFNFEQQSYIQKKPKLMSGSILKLGQVKQKNIQQYQVGQTGAPLIIQLLISYFNGKQELLNTEGLFRKSVSIDEETSLLKELSQQNYDYLQSIEDPHLIANGIKRYLSNLAEPIIPYKDFNELMETKQDNFNDKIGKIVTSLKNNRKMTLLLLVDFLKEKLLPRTQQNKMTQSNLSIVLGPCLMRSQVPSMKDLIFAMKSINAISIIFKDFDAIFGNAQQRNILIRKSVHVQERQTLMVRLEGAKLSLTQNNQKFSEQNILISPSTYDKNNGPTNDILNGIFQMMKQDIITSQQLQSQSNFDYDEGFEQPGQKYVKQ